MLVSVQSKPVLINKTTNWESSKQDLKDSINLNDLKEMETNQMMQQRSLMKLPYIQPGKTPRKLLITLEVLIIHRK